MSCLRNDFHVVGNFLKERDAYKFKKELDELIENVDLEKVYHEI